MGTYIGHCESCDITLEAESITLLVKDFVQNELLPKYGEAKTTEIVNFFKKEITNPKMLREDFFITKPENFDNLFSTIKQSD
jgi:hypothetical protein